MAAPVLTPLTMPDEEPTVATEALLLLHVPPETELESVVVPVPQTDSVPVISPMAGTPITEMTLVAYAGPQPLEMV